MMQWIESLHPILQAVIRAILWIGPVFAFVPVSVWWERRLLAWIQDRIGPNRVGPFGLLQPVADGIKLLFKEDILPANVDKVIFYLAPIFAMVPVFLLGAVIPWGPSTGIYGLLTPVANVDIGILFMMAASSLGAYGVVLAGYAGNNKYSLLGGLRGAAQLISYELGMGVALAAIVLASGSLKPVEIVQFQAEPLWHAVSFLQNWFIFTPFGFVAAVIFLVCMVAETNRAPFDLPEAENELIAGYHTEYSSMKFAMFFLSEYAAIFTFSGIFATMFLGGYELLPIRWDALAQAAPSLKSFCGFMSQFQYWIAPFAFIGKCLLGVTAFIWIRSTLPRLRYDQLMSIGWKSLLPLAVANLILVAIWIMSDKVFGVWGGFACTAAAAVMLYILFMSLVSTTKVSAFEPRSIRLVDPAEVAK